MKQLLILKTPFTNKYFATRAYKELDDGRIMVTGKKEDVTEQIEGIVEEQHEQLKQQLEASQKRERVLREALVVISKFRDSDGMEYFTERMIVDACIKKSNQSLQQTKEINDD